MREDVQSRQSLCVDPAAEATMADALDEAILPGETLFLVSRPDAAVS